MTIPKCLEKVCLCCDLRPQLDHSQNLTRLCDDLKQLEFTPGVLVFLKEFKVLGEDRAVLLQGALNVERLIYRNVRRCARCFGFSHLNVFALVGSIYSVEDPSDEQLLSCPPFTFIAAAGHVSR